MNERGSESLSTEQGEAEGFPGGSGGEESACSAGDLGSIPFGKIP